MDVTCTGPLFDGRATAALSAFCDAAAAEVADYAYRDVRTTLGSVLRNPTGYYESRIMSDRSMGGGRAQVHDSDVIYGNWLEGNGSRNATTRFKGYWTFRKVHQRIETRSVDIAQKVLDGYLSRMR